MMNFNEVELRKIRIKGKTYAERKEFVRSLAIEWSYYEPEDMSLLELINIRDWFYEKGKRYGLLTEFMENAIC